MKDLVNYQTHRHAQTCMKKGNNTCRFGFPLPPFDKTMILKGLQPGAKKQEAQKKSKK